MLLRLAGWGLVVAAGVALVVAFGTAVRLVAVGTGAVRGPFDVAGTVHSYTWPVLAMGLVGPALVHLADRPGTSRLLAGTVVLGITITAVGAAVASPMQEGWLWGGLVAMALGRTLIGVGLVGILAARRAWPGPLGAAAGAFGLSAAGVGAVVLWRMLPMGPSGWFTVFGIGFDSVGTWILAGGILAEIARTEGAPRLLDGVVGCAWIGVVTVDMVASPMGHTVSALALGVTGIAVVAYLIDAAVRWSGSARPSQPLALLALVLWASGAVGSGALDLGGVYLHDTFAEASAGHLHGPMLAAVVLVAWAAHRIADPPRWLTVGTAICAAFAGLGALRTAVGFAALGAAGMPRRYYTYVPDVSDAGWWQIAGGGVLFFVSLGAAALLLAVGAALSRPAGPAGGRPVFTSASGHSG